MTTKKQLLDAHEKYSNEATPALEELTAETLRTSGPLNSLAWIGVVAGAFVLCLGLLLLVTGG